MRWLALALGLAVMAFLPRGVAAEPRATLTAEAGHVRVRAEGNELLVRRTAPVACSTLEELTAMVERPLPAHVPVMRLVRSAPAGMVEYVFCILREGTLVMGEQSRVRDFPSGQYRFVRGDVGRAFPSLDRPGPWTWLVAVRVSREALVSLEIRAQSPRWPVEGVTVTPTLRP